MESLALQERPEHVQHVPFELGDTIPFVLKCGETLG